MMGRPPTRANFYAAGGLERAAHLRADAAWLAARLADPASRAVPVWRSQSLVVSADYEPDGPRAVTLPVPELRQLFDADRPFALLGLVEEVAHFAVDVSHLDPPDGAGPFGGAARFVDLRAIGPLLPRNEGALLAYARGLMHWHDRHRFCGVCGAATQIVEAGHQRRCTNTDCRASHFPRVDPAVIMLVHDGGDRVVMGRQRIWPAGMHSVLAGFVEPGESLEDAVPRSCWASRPAPSGTGSGSTWTSWRTAAGTPGPSSWPRPRTRPSACRAATRSPGAWSTTGWRGRFRAWIQTEKSAWLGFDERSPYSLVAKRRRSNSLANAFASIP
jgi:NAD+ diphosphatase